MKVTHHKCIDPLCRKCALGEAIFCPEQIRRAVTVDPNIPPGEVHFRATSRGPIVATLNINTGTVTLVNEVTVNPGDVALGIVKETDLGDIGKRHPRPKEILMSRVHDEEAAKCRLKELEKSRKKEDSLQKGDETLKEDTQPIGAPGGRVVLGRLRK